jgi:protein phosphatase PTC1
MEGRGEEELESQTSQHSSLRRSSSGAGTGGAIGGVSSSSGGGLARKVSGRRIRDFVKGLTGSGDKKDDEAVEDESMTISAPDGSRIEAIAPHSEKGLKRVLYTANVGDARAVLWWVSSVASGQALAMADSSSRGGKAVRLTYDHKGSDSQEAKRITDAGGFVMNNRVNGE